MCCVAEAERRFGFCMFFFFVVPVEAAGTAVLLLGGETSGRVAHGLWRCLAHEWGSIVSVWVAMSCLFGGFFGGSSVSGYSWGDKAILQDPT